MQRQIFYLIINILVCSIYVMLYGYIRALVSYRLGDKGGDVKSRLHLDPFIHIDTIGFLFMMFYNVGFIKPMRNQVMNFRRRKKSVVLIATIPNFIMLAISLLILCFTYYFVNFTSFTEGSQYIFIKGYVVSNDDIYYILYPIIKFAQLSIGVALYNIIPVFPLEGEKILNYNVSPNFRMKWSSFNKTLQMLLVLLTILGYIPNVIDFVSSYFISVFV